MRSPHTIIRRLAMTLVAAALLAGFTHLSTDAQQAKRSTDAGKLRKQAARFVHRADEGEPGRGRKAAPRAEEPAVVDVYKDHNAWSGENRDEATLAALGKVLGADHFVHPVSELADGISPDTDVVLITSNGFGVRETSLAQSHPVAQANLEAFVRRGGVAIVDMGDNDREGGFTAPGASGTPDMIFPTQPSDASLTAAAAGEDGMLGTADDHRLVRGADGIAGTSDDLDQSNIDACCHVAHGNLEDGIALPPGAVVLMTALFDGGSKPIVAEYCIGYGRVIVDTVTKEYESHRPGGTGPSLFMLSLFAYAMDSQAQAACRINGLIESVHTMQPGTTGALLEARLKAARADIEGGRMEAAAGKLHAFANLVRSRRSPRIAAPLIAEWTEIAAEIVRALRR